MNTDFGFVSFDDVSSPNDKNNHGFTAFEPIPKEDSFLNDIADYGKTILKGGIEGISRFGRTMGPLIDQPPDILERQTEILDKLFPTDEGFAQKSIRRGLKEAPTMLAFPGSGTTQTGVRTGIAGIAGQGAEELGLPEWAQTAAELTAYIGPDVMKKLLESGNDKKIIEFGKKKGLTDRQLTPLIQSEFKQRWLSKLVPKRGSTSKALSKTKQNLDVVYGDLQKSERASQEISEVENGNLINNLFEKLSEMPRSTQTAIEKDLDDLLSNKITGRSLMNFWKDINSSVGPSKKELSLLKEPIKTALNTLDPKLSQDFEMVNNLYQKYFPIYERLKPNITSDIIAAGKALGLAGSGIGLIFGHYPTLTAFLGEKAASKLAQQMLFNPRFQQLSKKMVVAINENKYSIAQKVTKEFRNLIKKFSPETAKKIEDISQEEFEDLIKDHHKSTEPELE